MSKSLLRNPSVVTRVPLPSEPLKKQNKSGLYAWCNNQTEDCLVANTGGQKAQRPLTSRFLSSVGNDAINSLIPRSKLSLSKSQVLIGSHSGWR